MRVGLVSVDDEQQRMPLGGELQEMIILPTCTEADQDSDVVSGSLGMPVYMPVYMPGPQEHDDLSSHRVQQKSRLVAVFFCSSYESPQAGVAVRSQKCSLMSPVLAQDALPRLVMSGVWAVRQ
eukprot:superscaffoldBa00001170_g9322